MKSLILFLPLVCCISVTANPVAESRLVKAGPHGKLQYQTWSPGGDIIPDFSHCGFGGGGVPLPVAPVVRTLEPLAQGSDDTQRIQAAIDEISKRPVQADGLRGALLLRRGTYRIAGNLSLTQSGVVLRGEGSRADGTTLVATGKARRSLIEIRGSGGPVRGTTRQEIIDRYVPVGARKFRVSGVSGLKVGSKVFVVRRGNAAWIQEIGMHAITPRPENPVQTRNWEPFQLHFDRVIAAIDGDQVTIDAPLTCAIDEQWGGGELVTYTDPGRIERVGVECLRAVSEFNPSVVAPVPEKYAKGPADTYQSDEEHAVRVVTFENVKHGWARDLVALHFYHGVSEVGGSAKWITVQDSVSLDPVSVIRGGRRYPFSMSGQLSLVLRCYSRGARHAFAVGARVPGPNVFLDCRSEADYGSSEPHHRWSCGGLYDNVEGEISIQDRQWMGTGHGWAGANYVAWNTRGSLICQKPPTAQNFAIGHVGRRLGGAFDRPPGHWESEGRHVAPRSLYIAQLQDRLGPEAVRDLTTSRQPNEVSAVAE